MVFARLSKHLRLVVFSYLDTAVLLHRISLLSKQQRKELQNAWLVYSGRKTVIDFKTGKPFVRECVLHGAKLESWAQKALNYFSLLDQVTIQVNLDTWNCSEHDPGELIGNLIGGYLIGFPHSLHIPKEWAS